MNIMRHRNPFGHSLLEISIVLSLLSILLLASAPSIQSSAQRQQTARFIQQLAFDLNHVASEARAKQVHARFEIIRDGRLYEIAVNNIVRKQVEAPPGMKLKSNFPSDRLRFYPDGQVSQAGAIDLVDASGKGYSFVVQLSSGRFHIRSVGR